MAEKVKLSKDGNSIDFVQTDSIPTSMKKFRHSPEIEGFYRFIYENDLQKEAYEILERIIGVRKVAKKALKQEAAQTKKMEQAIIKEQAATLEASKVAKNAKQPTAKAAPAKPIAKATKQVAVAKTKAVAKAKPTAKAKAKPAAKTAKTATKAKKK